MSVTTRTFSGFVSDLTGTLPDWLIPRVKMWIGNNSTNGILLDVDGNRLMVGPLPIPINPLTGAFSIPLPATNSADIFPASGRLYRVRIEMPDVTAQSGRRRFWTDYFTLVTDRDLPDALQDTVDVTTVSSELMTNLAALVAAAEAAAAAASTALSGKANAVHTHASSDITDLDTIGAINGFYSVSYNTGTSSYPARSTSGTVDPTKRVWWFGGPGPAKSGTGATGAVTGDIYVPTP